jgi:2-(1,2-epoxy-1,2-dihydrophenyl)acetyl-CoA isomerase
MSGMYAGLTPYEGYEDMTVKKNDDGVVLVTLNVPEKLNALTTGIRFGILRVLAEVNDDDEAKVMVLTGEGRGFSSGADLASGAARQREIGRQELETSRFAMVSRMREVNKPIIAAINGVAAGGGLSIAMACDLRIASDQARFVTAFIRRAILPDMGSTWLLPRLVGTSKALLMLLLSDEIRAEEAERTGLVDMVVPHEQLMERTMELATRLAKGPSVTLELAKKAIYHGLNVGLATQVEYEDALQAIVGRTEDNQEGRLAFREKRQPDFKGR